MNKVLLAYEDYPEMLTIQSVLKRVGFDVMTTSNEFSLPDIVLSFNPEIVIGYGKGSKLSTLGVGRKMREMQRWGGKVILLFPAGIKADPIELTKVRMDLALEAPLEVTRLLQVLGGYTNQDPRALVEKMMKAVAQEGEERQNSNPVSQTPKDEPIFVTGFTEKTDHWDVKGGQDIEEFNRLMGVPPADSTHQVTKKSARALDPRGEGPKFISKEQLDSMRENSRVASGSENTEPTFKMNNDPTDGAEDAVKLRAKIKAYDAYLAKLPLPELNGHRLREVKKSQKDLSQNWNSEELQNQDKMRREFTQALFKKKD